jgi:hypothetical protein
MAASASRQYREAQLISAVAAILDAGRPTYFRREGMLRHNLRSGRCLEGWTWRKADDYAAHILVLAFLELRAIRPSWDEGQPEYTRTRGSGRVFCANADCQRVIDRDVDQVARYCSEECRLRAKSKRGYDMHRAVRVNYARAQRVALRAIAEPRQCEWCAREFLPLDYTGKKPQRFCSLTCRSRYASSWSAEWRKNGPGPKPNGHAKPNGKANGHAPGDGRKSEGYREDIGRGGFSRHGLP